MANRAASTRNVALIGHGDTGKTTFVEHALHRAGVTSRVGTVPDGSTVSDFDPDERSRAHSIDTTPLHLKWNDKTIQFVDCPGYPDFSGIAVTGLWACDAALLFVNAASGMGVNTRRMWVAAQRLGKPVVIVISRCDSDTADPEATLSMLQETLDGTVLPFNLPTGKGTDAKGVMRCFGGDATDDPLFGDIEEAHSALVEAVVEADDDLLERYLGGEEIPDSELVGGLSAAIRAGTVVPVLFLAAGIGDGVGVGKLLDFIAKECPAADRPAGFEATDDAGNEVDLGPDGPFAAVVFKITTDVHVGKQAYLRVVSGSLPADGMCWASGSKSNVKVAHPSRPQGKEFESISKVGTGDVFCVAKIDELGLCDTISAAGTHVTIAPPPFQKSMVQVAVTSKARGEEHKIAAALGRMSDEDPSFDADRNPETNELVISGRSSLHLDIVMKRVKDRFKLEMETHIPVVPLKETVLGKADGHHRHKKQSGGRGQFGEVYLRIAPNERGGGFLFEDKTVGGSIPRNFVPAIEKGIREQMGKGVIAGYEVVDVRIEVYDGKHHPVDSSEAAFKTAGSRAFRKAFEKARPTLLEPVMNIEIDVPSRFMGDISSDLNTRRGRISGVDTHGDHQVIKASVPLSEVQTYSTDLRSITAGEGLYTLEYDHLDPVPSNIASRLIAAHEAARHDDD